MHTFYQCVQLQFTYNKHLIIQCLKLKEGHISYTQGSYKTFLKHLSMNLVYLIKELNIRMPYFLMNAQKVVQMQS